MTSVYETIEPVPFVQDHYAELILSSDMHDLRGAVACGEYLAQEQPGTRAAKNLVSASENALNDQELINICSDKDNPVFEASSAAGRIAMRTIEKVFPPIFKYHATTSRAIGLFSLTEYKVESGQPIEAQQLTDEYERLMGVTSGFSRGVIKKVWLERHYRNLLSAKRPLNHTELASAQASLDICKTYTRNPLARGDFMLDQWRLNRRVKQAAAA